MLNRICLMWLAGIGSRFGLAPFESESRAFVRPNEACGDHMVRRTNGLGIERIAPWEPIRVRATLCAIPARGESWSSCVTANKVGGGGEVMFT